MIKAMKIRLLPTPEQETLMYRFSGASRFAYNWSLVRWNELYKQTKTLPSINDIRKEFRLLKNQEEYKWLKEISQKTTDESIKNLDRAFIKFFKKISKHPKFKSKRTSKKFFYVRNDSFYFKENKCHMEKIGWVKFKTNLNIPNCKHMNPYCSYDGKYWYISFSYEAEETQTALNENLSIGIDLGIKDLAVVNVLDKPIPNINKTKTVKKIKKRLKRLQRQVSRKYEANKQGNKFVKTKNIIKLEKRIKLLYRRLTNIRDNHIHQATNKIVKLKPYRVVMEDLNVSGMMKNRHLSQAIMGQKFFMFRKQMKNKCENYGIQFVLADRFYPSSKACSCCGNVKDKLKLSERTYKCEVCGLEIDRDKNASINLANYGLV